MAASEKNSCAVGIDQMTVEAFDRQSDELLQFMHDKLDSRKCTVSSLSTWCHLYSYPPALN
jgi:hypothetical protein